MAAGIVHLIELVAGAEFGADGLDDAVDQPALILPALHLLLSLGPHHGYFLRAFHGWRVAPYRQPHGVTRAPAAERRGGNEPLPAPGVDPQHPPSAKHCHAFIAVAAAPDRKARSLSVAAFGGGAAGGGRAAQSGDHLLRRQRALDHRHDCDDLRLCGQPLRHPSAVPHRAAEAASSAMVCGVLDLADHDATASFRLAARPVAAQAPRGATPPRGLVLIGHTLPTSEISEPSL